MNIHSAYSLEAERMSNHQTILITGATAGIGRHAAIYLAGKGHRVIATGRSRDALDRLRAEHSDLALDAVRLDVTDPASIELAVREVERITGGRGIDAVVNNAGYGQAGPLAELDEAILRAQFETNVFGLMRVTRAFLPQLLARRSGRVVNISSIGGRVTFPLFGAYHASKYAVEAISDALRNELRPFGVQVALIEPGPIRSEFGDRAVATAQSAVNAESRYARLIVKADQLKALSERMVVGPEATSRALERALTARRPRARYVVPFSSWLMLLGLRLLPTFVVDAIMRRMVGLTPRALGLGRPAPLVAAGETGR
jgi:short-subunit dehydrogenase